MNERELLDGRVPTFEVVDGVKELWILAKRAGNCAEPADVLRVPPSGVVPPTIAVGDERGPHGPWAAILPAAGGARKASCLRLLTEADGFASIGIASHASRTWALRRRG